MKAAREATQNDLEEATRRQVQETIMKIARDSLQQQLDTGRTRADNAGAARDKSISLRQPVPATARAAVGGEGDGPAAWDEALAAAASRCAEVVRSAVRRAEAAEAEIKTLRRKVAEQEDELNELREPKRRLIALEGPHPAAAASSQGAPLQPCPFRTSPVPENAGSPRVAASAEARAAALGDITNQPPAAGSRRRDHEKRTATLAAAQPALPPPVAPQPAQAPPSPLVASGPSGAIDTLASAASAPASPFAAAAGGDGAAGEPEEALAAVLADQGPRPPAQGPRPLRAGAVAAVVEAAFGDRSYNGGAGARFDAPESDISAPLVSQVAVSCAGPRIGGDQEAPRELGGLEEDGPVAPPQHRGRGLGLFKLISARVLGSVFSIEQPEAAPEQQPQAAPQQQPGPAPPPQPQPAPAQRLQLPRESLAATAAMLQVGREAGMPSLPSASRLSVASSIDLAGRVVQFCSSSRQPSHWTAALDGTARLVESIGTHVEGDPLETAVGVGVGETRLRRLCVAALVVASKYLQVQAPCKIGQALTNRRGAQRKYGKLLAPVKPCVIEILRSLCISDCQARREELRKAGTLIRMHPLICSAGSLQDYSPKQLLAALADLHDHSFSPASLKTAMDEIKAAVAAAGAKRKTRLVFQEHVFSAVALQA
eukprot:tig00000382_g24554.t1